MKFLFWKRRKMKPINQMLIEVGEPSITSYIILDRCYRCEHQEYSSSMDRRYLMEYRIIALCVKCQDQVFDGIPYVADTSQFDHAMEKIFQLENTQQCEILPFSRFNQTNIKLTIKHRKY